MNAKETLKKLAEALNITSDKPEVVAEVVEQKTTEVQQEKPIEVEAVEPVETEVVVEPVAEAAVVKEDEAEEVAELEVVAEVKEDPRVAELEAQLENLKDILKKTMETPTQEAVAAPIDDKGLTHSPEKLIKSNHTKIGNKGKDTMSRVFKYINN